MRTLSSLALLTSSLALSGCYLAHVAWGQLRLLHAREPIERLLADPSTPDELRERLALVLETRAFAAELGLEVGGQYTSFAPWPGDRIVTALVATRPGELDAAGFRYPLIGRLPYKGFFDAERAAAEADRLRAAGLDVCAAGVPAYSTLGWLDDPVTGPMLRRPEGEVVETVVHELVHATVYLGDAPDLSEGVASFIGEEAAVRFYRSHRSAERAALERARVREDRLVSRALVDYRRRLAALYAAPPIGVAPPEERAALERAFRAEIAALPLATRDAPGLAEALRLNDACLAWYGTYFDDLPRYTALLDALAGDLPAFVARVRHAAESDDPRAALLGAPDA